MMRPFHVQGLRASMGLTMETLWSRRIRVVLERHPSGNDAALCSCAQFHNPIAQIPEHEKKGWLDPPPFP